MGLGWVLRLQLLGACFVLGVILPANSLAKGKKDKWTAIVDLRPTQFSVGMLEVQYKKNLLAAFNKEDLEEYLRDHRVPVVRGPGRSLFMLDRHHLVFAASILNIKEVRTQEEEDWSDLSSDRFWARMQKRGFLYLYDENGAGPHATSELPLHVWDLKDDAYRGLAWKVRTLGGFKKSSLYFTEFLWGNFFRARIQPWKTAAEFRRAVRDALVLAHSPEARHLPGYSGGRSCALVAVD